MIYKLINVFLIIINNVETNTEKRHSDFPILDSNSSGSSKQEYWGP